jgi:cytochrome c oxidase subunit 2
VGGHDSDDVYRSDERRNVGGRTEQPAPENVTLPPARGGSRSRVRAALLGLSLLSLLFLTSCSDQALVDQIKRLGFPPPAGGERGEHILNLWIGSWIAAFAVGFIVWGLILWASNRY